MSNDSIDKIDEEINSILNEEKAIHKKEEKPVEEEIVSSLDDTKKLDKIEDLEQEEVVEEAVEKEIEEVPEEKVEETPVEEAPVVEEPVPEDKKEEPPKKKSNFYLYLILGVVAAFVLFFLIFFLVTRPKTTKKKDASLTAEEQKEIIEDYGSSIQQMVRIYLDQKQKLLTYDEVVEYVGSPYDVVCDVHEIYEDGEVYLDDCSIDQVKTKYSYGKKRVEEVPVLNTDALHVFISKKDRKARLKEPTNLKDYEVYEFNIDEAYSGLRLLGEKDPPYVYYQNADKNVVIYDYKNNKKLFADKNYCTVHPIKYKNTYETEYAVVNPTCNYYKEGIINLRTGNIVTDLKYTISGLKVEVEALDKNRMLVAITDLSKVPFQAYGIIDYSTGKEIVPIQYYRNYSVSESDKYVILKDISDKKQHIFDFSGKELLTNYEIFDMAKDYVFVKDQGETKIVTPEGKTVYNFGKIQWESYSYSLTMKDDIVFRCYGDIKNDESQMEFRYNTKEKTGTISNTFVGAY